MTDVYDEIMHMVKQAAAQQAGDYKPFVYGHIASYDPTLHRVKLIVPSMRDDDDKPVLTGWMPLGTLGVGDSYGVQIAPVGGATFDEPTKGEQALIKVIDPDQGTGLAAHLAFNNTMAPPFKDLKPGEIAVKGQAGAYLRMHQSGDIEIACGKDGNYLLPKGDLRVKGEIIRGYGTGDQVTLGRHTHEQPNDSHGDTEQTTNKPNAGT